MLKYHHFLGRPLLIFRLRGMRPPVAPRFRCPCYFLHNDFTCCFCRFAFLLLTFPVVLFLVDFLPSCLYYYLLTWRPFGFFTYFSFFTELSFLIFPLLLSSLQKVDIYHIMCTFVITSLHLDIYHIAFCPLDLITFSYYSLTFFHAGFNALPFCRVSVFRLLTFVLLYFLAVTFDEVCSVLNIRLCFVIRPFVRNPIWAVGMGLCDVHNAS